MSADRESLCPFVSTAMMPPLVRLTKWLYARFGWRLRGGFFYEDAE